MKKKSTFLIFIILLISCLVITIFVFDLTDKENFEFFFGLKNPTDYVSDDFQTLHLEGVAYERIETPFDMVSPREPNSQYSILFANAEYKHSNLYTESTSKGTMSYEENIESFTNYCLGNCYYTHRCFCIFRCRNCYP